jgi:AcrR family transcriptional regulator
MQTTPVQRTEWEKMNSTIDQTKFEKQAIFEVSLKLLREGRFHAVPLDEIAYLANISAAMMDRIFKTREKLLEELTTVVTLQIQKELDASGQDGGSLKERFLSAWLTLYQFYIRYPDVIAFIDQFETLKKSLDPLPLKHPATLQSLIDLVSDESFASDTPKETLAWLLHENALSAAKLNMHCPSPTTPLTVAEIFWKGITVPRQIR